MAATGASILAVTLGVIALTAAFRLPVSGWLRSFGLGASLDYGAGPTGGFAKLSSRFVKGIDALDPTTVKSEGSRRAGDRVHAGTTDPFDLPRQRVSHPLTNNDFDRAYEVRSVPFTAETDTTGANQEAGEPQDCSPIGGTLWYRFTPARDMGVLLNTFGSSHATSLGVYSDGVEGLTVEGCDRDASGNSQLQLPLVGGTAYHIQLGAPATRGRAVFNMDPQGRIERVSFSPQGDQWTSYSLGSSISADGRFVAYESFGNGWVGVDGITCWDRFAAPGTAYVRLAHYLVTGYYLGPDCLLQIYLHDRKTRKTTLVTRGPSGAPAIGGHSGQPRLSADGRYLAFTSWATNLVASDTNQWVDAFVYDRITDRLERVSIRPDGKAADYTGYSVDISADGRFVAFGSLDEKIVPSDTNDLHDVFVRDRLLGTISRVSVSSSGSQGTRDVAKSDDRASDIDGSEVRCMSDDGRYVVFRSGAVGLVPDDTNHHADLFVHDRHTGATERVSLSSEGGEANGGVGPVVASDPCISTDGRYVVFNSHASNLVAGDSNGIDDLFVRDRIIDVTTRVSVNSQGGEAQDPFQFGAPVSALPPVLGSRALLNQDFAISADGRYVAFSSFAVGLVPRDTDLYADIFLHDRSTRTTIILTLPPNGRIDAERGPYAGSFRNGSQCMSMTPDARHIAFCSDVLNLVEDDTNLARDIFVWEWPRR